MLFPSKWSIIWWGACIESKKSPVIVSIQSGPSAQHFAMGFRVLSYSEVPFIDGVRFMSSRFGNCYQAWTCSTGHDDASVCLLWMDVRIGVVKIPWLSSQCQNTTKGLFGAVGGVGWTGRCVQFSPSTRRLFRPRWGWRPCCSACLEAETTWTLPRCPSSSNPVHPPRNWPAGHIKQRSETGEFVWERWLEIELER